MKTTLHRTIILVKNQKSSTTVVAAVLSRVLRYLVGSSALLAHRPSTRRRSAPAVFVAPLYLPEAHPNRPGGISPPSISPSPSFPCSLILFCSRYRSGRTKQILIMVAPVRVLPNVRYGSRFSTHIPVRIKLTYKTMLGCEAGYRPAAYNPIHSSAIMPMSLQPGLS